MSIVSMTTINTTHSNISIIVTEGDDGYSER